ncbi:MarR family winged helix-turn-helix transcriptional regulator [Antrihabitans spumae]|uniref:MarR family winged helix-turn-helix transcriptional regulator n=1 Tax=Antrihabitans spumae TaxID=3373370 RepID=A0ABW7KE72_9NOCA
MHNVATSVSSAALLAKVWQLSLLLVSDMDRGLAQRGITKARANVLTTLQAAGQAPMQSFLADQLGVTRRNVTGLLDSLERDGFVRRIPHESDRRAMTVHLTATGEAFAQSMMREAGEMAEHLFASIDELDRAAFALMLDTTIERFGQLTHHMPNGACR